MCIIHSFHKYSCKSNFATLKLGELSSWSYSFAVRDLTICNNCRVPWLIFLVWVRAQGHWAKLLSQAKLGGKKRKTRDHGQEEGKVSDKSTIFAARNITREHVWIITCNMKERRVWNKVTTRWEGPQSLSYQKYSLSKDGLLCTDSCVIAFVKANRHTWPEQK